MPSASYRFAVWAEDEPAEDTLDLGVSAAWSTPCGSRGRSRKAAGSLRPGAAEYSAVEELEGGGLSWSAGEGRDAAGLRRRRQPGGGAAAERCRDAAGRSGRDNDVARGGRGAERSRRRSGRGLQEGRGSLGRGTPSRCCGSSPRRWVAGSPACGVNEEGFIAVTAELSAVVEASMGRGTGGELRVHGQRRDTHLPCTAPDLRSFERALKERLAGGRRAGLGTATVNARRHRRDSCPNHPASAVPGSRDRVRRAAVDGPLGSAGGSQGGV